jgi:hypothetical protein
MKRFIAVYIAAAIFLATVTFAVAEPRAIHEGILTGDLNTAQRGTQVVVNPPPPPPRVWTGNVPVYPGGKGCGQANANLIARAMWDVDANDSQVEKMLLIISRESGCWSGAYNGNRRTGDDSWGFCQQNALAGFFKPGQLLAGYNRFNFASDPGLNARSCAAMYERCGFHPWNKPNYGCRRP